MNGIAEELAVFIVVGAHIIIGEACADVIGAGKELEEARLGGVHLRQPQEGVVNVFPLIALQVLVEVQRIGRRGIQLCLYGGVLHIHVKRIIAHIKNDFTTKFGIPRQSGLVDSLKSTIVFEPDGSISLETQAEEDDIYYDEISSGLLVSEIRRKRQELLESLSLFYRVFILKEDISDMLEE